MLRKHEFWGVLGGWWARLGAAVMDDIIFGLA